MKNKNNDNTSITINGITLPVRQESGDHGFVPPLMPYKDNAGLLKILAQKAIIESKPALLIGETGVGKTSAVRHLAALTNSPLRRVNMNGSMTAEDFLGQMLIKDGTTYWKDGVLTECVRNGYWLIVDEINAAGPEILFALHSLLDDDRYVVLTDSPSKEVVRPHENFRIFATMNPQERYAGTQELNRAFAGRWPVKCEVDIPSADIEYGMLSGASEILPADTLTQFKSYVTELRKSYQKEELDVFVSPRDVASIVDMYQFTKDMLQAIAYTILPLASSADKKAIHDLAKLHFLTPSTLATAPVVAEITNPTI